MNLIDRAVEVYREPLVDASAPYGWRYRSAQVLIPAAVITPLMSPSKSIAVADLLP